jgi:hypothetical protein
MRFSLRKDFNWGKNKAKTKHYNVDTFFFQDDNKNGIYDPNEKGISNGFLKMASEKASSEGKSVSLSPLISDKSGKVSYTNIPQGEYEMDISRMVNEDGYFNFNSSKQLVRLKKDTVCYIPFVKAYMISGTLTIKLATITSGKINSAKNIKITATDSRGQQYSALTDMSGHYVLPVAGKEVYTVTINNPYGANVEVKNNDSKVEFTEKDEVVVNFEFIEKARKVRMKSALGPTQERELKEKQQNQEKKTTSEIEKATVQKAVKVIEPSASNEEGQQKIQTIGNNPGVEKQSLADEIIRKEKSSGMEYWIYNNISPDKKAKTSYWVVGVFKSIENTNHRINQLKLQNVLAKYIYNEANKLYYVYIKESNYQEVN